MATSQEVINLDDMVDEDETISISSTQEDNDTEMQLDDSFFVLQVGLDLYFAMPHVIFAQILSWIPAYPYLYSLRRVCKKWKRELEDHVFENQVTLLDLLELDHSKDEHKSYCKFLNFKEVEVNLPTDAERKRKQRQAAGASDSSKKRSAKKSQSTTAVITRASVIDFLGDCFPGVTTLKFHIDHDMCSEPQGQHHWRYHQLDFKQFKSLVKQFPLLEHLLIVINKADLEAQRCSQFLSALEECTREMERLISITIINLPMNRFSLTHCTNTFKAMAENLPSLQKIDLKFCILDGDITVDWNKQFQQVVFGGEQSNPAAAASSSTAAAAADTPQILSKVATGSLLDLKNEQGILDYFRYLLEVLRLPIRSLAVTQYMQRRYAWQTAQASFVEPLQLAINNGFTNLAWYLLWKGLYPDSIQLKAVVASHRKDYQLIVRAILECVGSNRSLGTNVRVPILQEFIMSVTDFQKLDSAFEHLFVGEGKPQLSDEDILTLLKECAASNRHDFARKLINLRPGVTLLPQFQFVLAKVPIADYALPFFTLLVTHGLSFTEPMVPSQGVPPATFMSHFVQQVLTNTVVTLPPTGVTKLAAFINERTQGQGGLAAALAQELPEGVSSSGLSRIVQLCKESNYQRFVELIIAFEKAIGKPAFYNLKTERTGKSLLQLFAATSSTGTSSVAWGFSYARSGDKCMEYLADGICSAVPGKEILAVLPSCVNACLFRKLRGDVKVSFMQTFDENDRTIPMQVLQTASAVQVPQGRIFYVDLFDGDAAIREVLLSWMDMATQDFTQNARWLHRDSKGKYFTDYVMQFLISRIKLCYSIGMTTTQQNPQALQSAESTANLVLGYVSRLPESIRDELFLKNRDATILDFARCASSKALLHSLCMMEPRLLGRPEAAVGSADLIKAILDLQTVEPPQYPYQRFHAMLANCSSLKVLLPSKTPGVQDKLTPLQYALEYGPQEIVLPFYTSMQNPYAGKSLDHLHRYQGRTVLEMAVAKDSFTLVDRILRNDKSLFVEQGASFDQVLLNCYTIALDSKNYALAYYFVRRGVKPRSRFELMLLLGHLARTEIYLDINQYCLGEESYSEIEKALDHMTTSAEWFEWLSLPDRQSDAWCLSKLNGTQCEPVDSTSNGSETVFYSLLSSHYCHQFACFLFNKLKGEQTLSQVIAQSFNKETSESILHRFSGNSINYIQMKILLESCDPSALGTFINLTNKEGNSALHLAAIAGVEESVKLLLDHKANPTIKNQEGKIPGDLTQKIKCVRMLQKAVSAHKAAATKASKASASTSSSSSKPKRGSKRKVAESAAASTAEGDEEQESGTGAASAAAAQPEGSSRRKRIRLTK